MKLLALACATRGGGACLISDDAVHVEEYPPEITGGRGLLPAARHCLERGGLSARDLDYVAVCLGPGSFTGIRVGLAAALALVEASGAALLGLDSLSVLHHNARELLRPEDTVGALLGAGRGLVYVRRFRRGEPLEEPALMSLDVLLEQRPAEVYLGRIPESLAERLAPERLLQGFATLRPRPLAEATLMRIEDDARLDPLAARPLYLKRPPAKPLEGR